ncbi:MAG: retroviral-like aspartic protease family protein [Candidatus Margulisbacteria bacterium]|jgi:hypothetical protein|nr:retroviral-like aspartic protease family protein [Candidatus Margulisiibacteriota bacterium]
MEYRSFTNSYPTLSRTLKNNIVIARPGDENQNFIFMALWDTGATNTMITQKVVDLLKLRPVNIREVFTPSGKMDAYCHYVDVFLPNKTIIQRIPVLQGEPMGCDVLIGMDIIGLGDFAVSNFENKTTFSFRLPSKQKVDFLKS